MSNNSEKKIELKIKSKLEQKKKKKTLDDGFKKNKVIDEGFEKAFLKLILLIVNSTDQKKIDKTKINEIKGMIESFSIKEEKFIDEIYYLTLNVSFNKKKLFNLLESKNIFPSLPVKKNVFFIPIILDENNNEILIFSESEKLLLIFLKIYTFTITILKLTSLLFHTIGFHLVQKK